MPEATTYNGWSNRETWLAGLWLTNEEASFDLLRQAIKYSCDSSEQAAWLEESLRLQLDCEAGDANLWSDLLTTAFGRINWLEVVEHYTR